MIAPRNVPRFIKKIEKNGFLPSVKKVIVLNSYTADYSFDGLLSNNTYDMSKMPFNVPQDINEFAALSSIYHEQLAIAAHLLYPIITISYNRMIGKILEYLRSSESNQPYISKWLIFAFFMEDEYLKDLKVKDVSLLDIKANEIVNMLDYHFIKKYEFPLHYNITSDYFKSLVNDNLEYI